jgi:hypothetical protein
MQAENEMGLQVIEDLEIDYGYDQYIIYKKYGKMNFESLLCDYDKPYLRLQEIEANKIVIRQSSIGMWKYFAFFTKALRFGPLSYKDVRPRYVHVIDSNIGELVVESGSVHLSNVTIDLLCQTDCATVTADKNCIIHNRQTIPK